MGKTNKQTTPICKHLGSNIGLFLLGKETSTWGWYNISPPFYNWIPKFCLLRFLFLMKQNRSELCSSETHNLTLPCVLIFFSLYSLLQYFRMERPIQSFRGGVLLFLLCPKGLFNVRKDSVPLGLRGTEEDHLTPGLLQSNLLPTPTTKLSFCGREICYHLYVTRTSG